MAIQHKDIPDNQLHEPKGAALASPEQVYVADGVGSGSFKRPSLLSMKDYVSDSGSSNRRLLTNGTNGIRTVVDNVFGAMTITNNNTPFVVTAAVDGNLETNSDYKVLTGVGAPWSGENLFGGMIFSVDKLVVPVAGVYRIDTWTDVKVFPTNTAFLAIKVLINGVTHSNRMAKDKSNSGGDSGQLNAFGLLTLNAGDQVQLELASSANGNLVIYNLNNLLTLVRQL